MRASRNAVSEICVARALYVGDDVYINRTGQQFLKKKKYGARWVGVSCGDTFIYVLFVFINRIDCVLRSILTCVRHRWDCEIYFSMGSLRSTLRVSSEAWNWMCYMDRPLHSDQSFSIVSRSLKKLEASHNVVYVYLIVHGLRNPNASFRNE